MKWLLMVIIQAALYRSFRNLLRSDAIQVQGALTEQQYLKRDSTIIRYSLLRVILSKYLLISKEREIFFQPSASYYLFLFSKIIYCIVNTS